LSVTFSQKNRLQKMMNTNGNLEATWSNLDAQEHALKLEQKYLKEIWLKVCEQHKENEKAREKLEAEKLEAGLHFVDPSMLIKLNVGGQEFETTAGVLCRDEFSILAGICRGSGKVLDSRMQSEPDEGGPTPSFFLDRDWWIFRHILQFLRSDVLPEDPLLVEEMYNEASFYRLRILKEAIDKLPKGFFVRKTSTAELRSAHQFDIGVENNPYLQVCDCGKYESCRLCDHQSYMLQQQQQHRHHGGSTSGTRAAGGGGILRQVADLPDPFGFTNTSTMASHTRRAHPHSGY
jgi:hypothetical protein